MKENLVFVTGYAKLPQGITAAELYSVIVVGVIVDKDSSIIKDVDCSLVTSVARSFVKDLYVGQSILDYPKLADLLNSCYHGSARKALLSAFKIINEKYKNLLEQDEM